MPCIADGLLRASDVSSHPFPETAVDYDAVTPFKLRVFETAWSNFNAGAGRDLKVAYEEFCHDIRIGWKITPCSGH